MAESSFPDGFYKRVEGFITEPEAELLYSLARRIPPYGRVVEIGAYRARSTIALALGALEAQGSVYSIDHHPSYDTDGTHFGKTDNQFYYDNVAYYGVGDTVNTINLPSHQVIICWVDPIDLLWIDGGHEYEQVRHDWYAWSWHTNLVAMHDTAGHHPAVTALVHEIRERGEWEVIETVDAITVFRRLKK